MSRYTRALISVADKTWETDFEGLLRTHGATLKMGGVEFTEIDGHFDIRATNTPDAGTSLEIEVAATRALAMGRELTDVETPTTVRTIVKNEP